MLVVPEMRIQQAVRDGFAGVSQNLALLDDLFFSYPAEMRAEVNQYLTHNKVEVVLNWPREDVKLPTVAIINANDAEEAGRGDTLGDFLEELEVVATDATLTQYQGVAFNGSYQLLVLTGDPRASMYLSHMVLSFLILNSENFQAAGMHNMTLGASDLRFEEGMLPAWANSRMVTMTCLHYHAVPVTERLLTQLNVVVSMG